MMQIWGSNFGMGTERHSEMDWSFFPFAPPLVSMSQHASFVSTHFHASSLIFIYEHNLNKPTNFGTSTTPVLPFYGPMHKIAHLQNSFEVLTKILQSQVSNQRSEPRILPISCTGRENGRSWSGPKKPEYVTNGLQERIFFGNAKHLVETENSFRGC